MPEPYTEEVGHNKSNLTQEQIEKIRELVPDRFKKIFFIKGINWESIYSDPLYALATLGEETEKNICEFPFILPSNNFDVARTSQFQRLLDEMNIEYGKRDVWVAFRTKSELHDAILTAWFVDWEYKWAFEDYMESNGLFDRMPVLRRLKAIERNARP